MWLKSDQNKENWPLWTDCMALVISHCWMSHALRAVFLRWIHGCRFELLCSSTSTIMPWRFLSCTSEPRCCNHGHLQREVNCQRHNLMDYRLPGLSAKPALLGKLTAASMQDSRKFSKYPDKFLQSTSRNEYILMNGSSCCVDYWNQLNPKTTSFQKNSGFGTLASINIRCVAYSNLKLTLKCTLGWNIFVWKRTVGGIIGYCSGTWIRSLNIPPSNGVSLGPYNQLRCSMCNINVRVLHKNEYESEEHAAEQ